MCIKCVAGKFQNEFKRTFRCSHESSTCVHKHGYVTDILDLNKQRSQINTRSVQRLPNNSNLQQSTEVIPLNAIINIPQNEKQE